MKRKISISLLFVFSICFVFAGEVKKVQVFSASMQKNIEVVIVTPDDLSSPRPVVYLLHGFGGVAGEWVKIRKDLADIADQYGMIFISPDGEKSWYWDSPANPSCRFETFISKELVNYVDANYNTIKDRKGRAISGLSMGGHGALWNAFHHKDVFGAAGSTSGGVDIRPFPKNWEMSKQLGEKSDNPENWEKYTVINNIHLIKNGELALIIDCGYDDFFFGVNNALHEKLLENKIDHDYLVRPGGHDMTYWNNSILYHILFFHTYFNK